VKRIAVCIVSAAAHVTVGCAVAGGPWPDPVGNGCSSFPDRLPGGTGVNLIISGGRPLGMPELWSGSIEYARRADTVGWAVAWEVLGADVCQEHTLQIGTGARIGRFRAGAVLTGTSWWFAGGLAAAVDGGAAVAVDVARELELRIAGSGLGRRLDTPAASLGARYRWGMWDVGLSCDIDHDGVRWNLRQRAGITTGATHLHVGYAVTAGNVRCPPDIGADLTLYRGRYFAGYVLRWNPWFPVEHRLSVGVATGGTVPEAAVPQSGRLRGPVRSSGTYTGPPVNLNTATAAEVERLPGIGRVLARRIIAYRDQVGVIRSLDELRSVGRISGARIAAIAPFVTVASATDVSARTSAPGSENAVSTRWPGTAHAASLPVGDGGPANNPVVSAGQVYADTTPAVTGEPPSSDDRTGGTHTGPSDEPEADLLARINRMVESDFTVAGFSPFDARNIVRYRGRHGRFRAVRQLYDVPNIDRRIVAAFLAGCYAAETDRETP